MARRSGGSRRARASNPFLPFLPSLPTARRRVRRAATGLSLPGLPAPAKKKAAPRRRPGAGTRTAGRWLSSSWTGPAGSRSYDVYLPAGHRRTSRVPLVVLLHGWYTGDVEHYDYWQPFVDLLDEVTARNGVFVTTNELVDLYAE